MHLECLVCAWVSPVLWHRVPHACCAEPEAPAVDPAAQRTQRSASEQVLENIAP